MSADERLRLFVEAERLRRESEAPGSRSDEVMRDHPGRTHYYGDDCPGGHVSTDRYAKLEALEAAAERDWIGATGADGCPCDCVACQLLTELVAESIATRPKGDESA